MILRASILLFLIVGLAAPATLGQRSQKEKANYYAHQAEFDYLLGDWEFSAENEEFGKFGGKWSAVRLADGAEILDEYRVVGEQGETFYASITLRSYNAAQDRWELISAESGKGLQNFGTAHRVGSEMHIEQKFGVVGPRPTVWRIRYYDIQADRFLWSADRSIDGGKTWVKNYMKIEAHRIGPARFLGPIAPAKKAAGGGN